MEGLRRRRHPVNGQAEGPKDRTRLGERHGAAARDLQQCRSVEATEHDAEASVERHLAEHLRRWHAGGENCLGHPRLLLAEPRRETLLEQFYDLTWRPGVDVRRAALVDLLPEGSPHRPSSRRSRPNTNGGQKRTLPRSRLPAGIVACPRPQRLPESQSDARFETSPVQALRDILRRCTNWSLQERSGRSHQSHDAAGFYRYTAWFCDPSAVWWLNRAIFQATATGFLLCEKNNRFNSAAGLARLNR